MLPLFEQVLEKYPEQVKVVFKHFPLSMHKFAYKAAVAAEAAHQQGKFWQIHDLLFENVSKLSDEKIAEVAAEVGLDMEKYEAAVADPATANRVRKDYSDGIAAGVRGTPTIFVNGRKLKSRSLKAISVLIDKELAILTND